MENNKNQWFKNPLYSIKSYLTIKKNMKEKDEIAGMIKTMEVKIGDCEKCIDAFNVQCFELLGALEDIEAYDKYDKWKIEYNSLGEQKQVLETDSSGSSGPEGARDEPGWVSL